MKKFLYLALAAIAALSSCSSDDIVSNENENQNQNVNAPVFTATIEGEAASRTQLVEGSTAGNLTKVAWLNTDKMIVWSMDETYTLRVMGNYNVTPDASDATSATLTAAQDIKYVNSEAGDAAMTVAYYPASISYLNVCTDDMMNAMIGSGNALKVGEVLAFLQLPATQQYNADDISAIAPMVAIDQTGSTSLKFKNLTSLLAITVSGDDFTSVSKIVVSSDKQMNGMFILDSNNNVATTTGNNVSDREKLVTLNCKDNKNDNTTISAGSTKTFYVSIPVQTYGYLQIDVTDGTNTKTMKTTATSISVERNKIYPIAFADNQTQAATTGTTKATINGNEVDVAWVQLWKNGPKWALYNIGATNTSQVGSYFAFGASEVYTASNANTYSSLSKIQGTSDDTAKNLWGSNWQMPTHNDYLNLLNTTYTNGGVWLTAGASVYGVAGLLVIGKGEYSSNSVFFPASGFYAGSNMINSNCCFYWSSNSTSRLYASSTEKYVQSGGNGCGLPVRAIVVE